MDLLKQLSLTPAVPGHEDRLRDLIAEQTRGLFDELHTDALGNLIGRRGPRPEGRNTVEEPLKLMLAAHMDQIGFVVRYIDEKGFVRVQNAGGFDTRNLFARIVTVFTDEGELTGVMNPAGKPVHIASDEERKKVPEISDFVIDLGLPAEEVKKQVKVGQMVVLKAGFDRVGRTVVGQAMDNRVACWLAIRTLQAIAEHPHHCELIVAFTVQEEVGCRGAGPAAQRVNPDLVISLDTTLCVDTPGVPDDQSVTKQGEGAALLVMDSSMISDPGMIRDLEKIAINNDIKHQRSILPRGGNDGSSIQRKAEGFRTAAVVCPTRYIHTVTEMVREDDLYACRDLLTAYARQLG